MSGPDQYITMGAIAAGIGILVGAWALWHDWRAVEREKKRLAEKPPTAEKSAHA